MTGVRLVPAANEGRDLSRPLPHRAAPQPVDDGRLQLFESVAGLLCELAADIVEGRNTIDEGIIFNFLLCTSHFVLD